MVRIPQRITHVHLTWFTTICLDVVLVLILGAWYAAFAPGAPTHPNPSTGQVFEFLVPSGYSTGGLGRRAITRTVFAPAYVDAPTFLIGCLLFANGILFVGGALWSFLKQLGEPVPPQ